MQGLAAVCPRSRPGVGCVRLAGIRATPVPAHSKSPHPLHLDEQVRVPGPRSWGRIRRRGFFLGQRDEGFHQCRNPSPARKADVGRQLRRRKSSPGSGAHGNTRAIQRQSRGRTSRAGPESRRRECGDGSSVLAGTTGILGGIGTTRFRIHRRDRARLGRFRRLRRIDHSRDTRVTEIGRRPTCEHVRNDIGLARLRLTLVDVPENSAFRTGEIRTETMSRSTRAIPRVTPARSSRTPRSDGGLAIASPTGLSDVLFVVAVPITVAQLPNSPAASQPFVSHLVRERSSSWAKANRIDHGQRAQTIAGPTTSRSKSC